MKLRKDRPRAKYKCRQIELYAICQIGWNSCLENILAFSAVSTIFDPAYVAARKAAILAAQQLPDFQARNKFSEESGIQLTNEAVECIAQTDFLFSYIERAWDGEFVKPNIEAAGSEYRPKAASGDWESVSQIMISGQTFITDNSAKLLADGGMPAGFPAAHLAAQTAFNATYELFKDARQDELDMTDDKIIANNNIYDEMMAMFAEAQNIFRDNASLRERFVFANVKHLVSAPGAAGLKGTVIDANTSIPINGAIVTILELERSAPTDEDGKYQIAGIPSGRYTILITFPGYEDYIKTDVQIPVGTNHTQNATLTPVAP